MALQARSLVAVAVLAVAQGLGWPAAAMAQDGPAQPRGPRELVTAVQVAAGSEHNCVLMSDGLVYSAGDNNLGQLGRGDVLPESTSVPAPISAPSGDPLAPGEHYVSIACGNDHALAVTNLGHAYAWGDNTSGQVGGGPIGDGCENCAFSTPQRITKKLTAIWPEFVEEDFTSDEQFISVWAGGTNSAAITHQISTDTYHLYMWGTNYRSQIADRPWGEYIIAYYPILVASASSLNALSQPAVGGRGYVDVSDDTGHACVLNMNNQAWCWGSRGAGQTGTNISPLSDPLTTPMNVSTALGVPNTWSFLTAGAMHTCALNLNGNVYCWGDNSLGQVGCDDPVTPNYTIPSSFVKDAVPGSSNPLTGIVAISCGYFHNCAVTADGSMYCWGDNSQGQLGDDTVGDPKLRPVQVAGGLQFSTALAAANIHTCAITQSGEVYCWGYNSSGQFGIGGGDLLNNFLVPTYPMRLPRLRGDLDHSGVVDGADIAHFVLVLTDSTGYYGDYYAQFCPPYSPCSAPVSAYNADCNADGVIDAADVAPFVSLLLGS